MVKSTDQGRLPDFIIAGAQKGGTTAAGENLDKHDDVWLALDRALIGNRESHFFELDRFWEKGVDWYKSLFTGDGLCGEKSPGYLSDPRSHERMASIVPHAKLIVILRDPVTRAYSAWNHGRSDNWGETSALYRRYDFEGLLKNHRDAACVVHGHYAGYLKHLFGFYPREQVYISISERVKEDMEFEYDKMLEFLGSKSRGDVGYRLYHRRPYKEEMTDWAREYLREYYRPYNETLFNLLGYDIPEWKEGK